MSLFHKQFCLVQMVLKRKVVSKKNKLKIFFEFENFFISPEKKMHLILFSLIITGVFGSVSNPIRSLVVRESHEDILQEELSKRGYRNGDLESIYHQVTRRCIEAGLQVPSRQQVGRQLREMRLRAAGLATVPSSRRRSVPITDAHRKLVRDILSRWPLKKRGLEHHIKAVFETAKLEPLPRHALGRLVEGMRTKLGLKTISPKVILIRDMISRIQASSGKLSNDQIYEQLVAEWRQMHIDDPSPPCSFSFFERHLSALKEMRRQSGGFDATMEEIFRENPQASVIDARVQFILRRHESIPSEEQISEWMDERERIAQLLGGESERVGKRRRLNEEDVLNSNEIGLLVSPVDSGEEPALVPTAEERGESSILVDIDENIMTDDGNDDFKDLFDFSPDKEDTFLFTDSTGLFDQEKYNVGSRWISDEHP